MKIWVKILISVVPGLLFALLCSASESKLKSTFGWVAWQPHEVFLRRYNCAYFGLLFGGVVIATAIRFTTSDAQVGRGWISLLALAYLTTLLVTGVMTACTMIIARGIH